MTHLFNSRALKRRHRVGERSGPITLLSPPLKATLALGVLIAAGGGLWATLARIPLTVEGTGVLLPVGTITTSISQTDGVNHWMFHLPHRQWQEQAWEFQRQPGSFSDQAMAQLAHAILTASAARHSAMTEQTANPRDLLRYRGTRFDAGRLLLWVVASSQQADLSSALDQLDRTLRDSAAQRSNIEKQQAVLRRELSSSANYLASMQTLAAKGYVNRASILQQQATVDGIKLQIHSNDNLLISLSRDSEKAYQALRSQLASVVQQQLIFTPRELYLDQIMAQNMEAVSRGQELLKLSDQKLNGAALVPAFLGNNEMAQVRPGMRALATPAGYKRAAVGGIRARVVYQSRLPGTLETVASRIGVRSLAQEIVAQEQSPTLVMLELERTAGSGRVNSGGYRWSSGSDLPFPPTPGERLDVEITTRWVRPIELVLPSLKQLFGLTPPDTPPRSASGGDTP